MLKNNINLVKISKLISIYKSSNFIVIWQDAWFQFSNMLKINFLRCSILIVTYDKILKININLL